MDVDIGALLRVLPDDGAHLAETYPVWLGGLTLLRVRIKAATKARSANRSLLSSTGIDAWPVVGRPRTPAALAQGPF